MSTSTNNEAGVFALYAAAVLYQGREDEAAAQMFALQVPEYAALFPELASRVAESSVIDQPVVAARLMEIADQAREAGVVFAGLDSRADAYDAAYRFVADSASALDDAGPPGTEEARAEVEVVDIKRDEIGDEVFVVFEVTFDTGEQTRFLLTGIEWQNLGAPERFEIRFERTAVSAGAPD